MSLDEDAAGPTAGTACTDAVGIDGGAGQPTGWLELMFSMVNPSFGLGGSDFSAVP